RLQTGDTFIYHVNLAVPARSTDVPSTSIGGLIDTWKVQGASATTPFDPATVSSFQTPNSTSVSQPNFAPTTDGELVISLAQFVAPANTLLGVPSGTNPTFVSQDNTPSQQVNPGIDVNSADATGTAPIGARTFTATAAVSEATVVLFAAISADTETGATTPYAYGDYEDGAYTDADVNVATGVYTTSATDLVMPGRVLGLDFTRTYNSSDATAGPLGPAWTHSYNWNLTDATSLVTIRRGDGR